MINHLELGIRTLVEEFIADGKPCASQQSIEARREGYIASTTLAGSSPVMAEEFEDELGGIKVKIYKPLNAIDLPVTVYFHGGCFVSGGFKTHEQQLRQLAALSKTLVICIQYRLAPEHIYPAAHDDVFEAVLNIQTHGHKYGANTDNIVFVGDSAGGQLALATSMRLKNSNLRLPKKQILIYPMLDPFGVSNSYKENGTDFIITAQMLLSGFALYGGSQEQLKNTPELNLLDADLSNLPVTTIITAEFDPLRDEGEQLYKKLLSHGVEAYCQRYLGVIHGFYQLSGVSGSARKCIEYIAQEINTVAAN